MKCVYNLFVRLFQTAEFVAIKIKYCSLPLHNPYNLYIWILLLVALTQTNLYPIWAGREAPSEVDKIEWVYGENKPDRVIGFIEFENLSTTQKKIYDSYRSSLPRLLAEKLKKIKTIETSSNDFIPIQKNLSKQYTIKEINFKDAEANQILFDEILTYRTIVNTDLLTNRAFTNQTQATNVSFITNNNANSTIVTTADGKSFQLITKILTNQTSLGPVVVTNVSTNQLQIDVASLTFFDSFTNARVAYFYTNEELQKYTFYLFKKNPSLYYDPELLAPYEKYFTSKPPVLLLTNKEGRVVYPIERNPKKPFKINDKLYRLNDAPLGNILSISGIDYFVYGAYQVNRNRMELNVYVINTYEKKITHIFNEQFSSSEVQDKTDIIDTRILSFLQQKGIVRNIQIKSNPPGAMLKLNEVFVGELPITIEEWVNGEYTFEAWNPNQLASRISGNTKMTTKSITLNKSESETTFSFTENPKGKLNINIANGVGGDYYLNTKLVGKNTNSYSEELFAGDYYVSVAKSNYVTRNFKLNVEPKTKTTLTFGMEEVKPKTPFEKIFLDYSLNTKIFGALSLGLGAASFGLFVHTLRLEDQKNSSQKRVSELNLAGLNSSSENRKAQQLSDDYYKYLSISLGVFSGSVVSLVTMLIFHTLDVYSKHAPIETSFNHKGDVEIKYIKEF